MSMLDTKKIKKLRAGEICGYVAAGVCAAGLAFFIAGFITAQAKDMYALRLATLIAAPIIMVLSAGVSAFCNLKFGNALDREISAYVQSVLVENAALLHPERDSLTFTVAFDGQTAYLKVNGYKEKIAFDFSALGSFKGVRRSSLSSVITSKLGAAFCRLYERGAGYKSVECAAGGKKPVKIIDGGVPDRKIYREFLKTK